jgi:putative membrane protein
MTMEELLPLIDTILIIISGVAVITGFVMIKRRNINFHKYAMITATTFAALFLVVYVTRYLLYGSKLFVGEGWILAVYIAILASHVILSIAIIPMVLITLYRAFKRQFVQHRRIARFTVPVWLYVVVTGWIIYLMLYHLPVENL